jgi:hypothetical protein
VKDALREYGRTVAIFASAGLVLSLLVGLLARNPFGVMLLRAVLFAILFGGVGAGMQYVVRRFLPEITGGEAAPSEGADDAAAKPAGSTIDIVLPEELPAAEGAPEARGEALEDLPGTVEAEAAAPVEELESAEGGPGTDEAPAQNPGEPVGGGGGLDALPDIGPVGTDGSAARSPTRFPGARAKPANATRDVLEREDPASLARAVRTVLKREERS